MNSDYPNTVIQILTAIEKKYADYIVRLGQLADSFRKNNTELTDTILQEITAIQAETDTLIEKFTEKDTLAEKIESVKLQVHDKDFSESADIMLVKIKRLVKYACELEKNIENSVADEMKSVKSSLSHVQQGKNLKQLFKKKSVEPKFLDKRR